MAAAAAQRLAFTAAAAVGARRAVPEAALGGVQFVVLVCAHDEERGLPATLAALERVDWPREEREVVVVADNCADDTAGVARAAGATVLERFDPARRGKPHALAFGLAWLAEHRPGLDAVLIVDADCLVSENILGAAAARLLAGADAVQVDYVVANAGASRVAGLRYAAFALVNTVRPQGRDALGLSCGLLGSGMVLPAATLAAVPWSSFGLAEDLEQHGLLVGSGLRVRFVSEASVSSAMPVGPTAAREQERRWEGGRLTAARGALPLAFAGVIRGDPARVDAALEMLFPPQSLLLAATLATGLVSASARSPLAKRLSLFGLAAHATAVIGGLLVVGAPAAAWRGLALAPWLMARKLGLALELARGGGATAWQRTARGASPPDA